MVRREKSRGVEAWSDFDRQRLVEGFLAGGDWLGVTVSPLDVPVLRRLVVVVDAGMGKSVLMKFLRMELGRKQEFCLPVYLDIGKLPHSVGELPRHLLEQVRGAAGVEPGSNAEQERRLLIDIERLLLKGRVIFLLDGLDQVATDSAVMITLRALLNHRDWSRCGYVIAGRPYSVLNESELWHSSSRSEFPWRFARLEEFTEVQQRRFLGKTEDGAERFDLIPPDGREILKVPRVLEYLQELKDHELHQIRTPSDVYWKALRKLIEAGIEKSASARDFGWMDGAAPPRGDQIWLAFDLLGTIAFQMAVDFSGQSDAVPEAFERVEDRQLPKFKNRVFQRVNDSTRQSPSAIQDYYGNSRRVFDSDFQRLIDMNQALDHGLLDSTQPLQFRNRSLQEWFAAYWLARHCTPTEANEFWQMVFQAGLEQTEAFYWINRYLSEMPAEARDDENWVRSAGIWYRSGDGTIAGTKRSTEMLFRSWRTMHELAGEPVFDWWDCSYEELIESEAKLKRGEGPRPLPHAPVPRARDVLAAYRGEFQSILDDTHRATLTPMERVARQAAAKELTENFIAVESGRFPMGSATSGLSPEWRQRFADWIARLSAGEDAVELAKERWPQPWEKSKAGKQRWQNTVDWAADLIRRGMEAVERDRKFETNEASEEEHQEVAGFELGEFPLINAWYRLFAPGHGTSSEFFATTFQERSQTLRDPVIYISWWDAWALAEWVQWSAESGVMRCRLPHEPEFEFVAKDRDHPEWDYWWGSDFDESDLAMCNASWRIKAGMTRPPEQATPSFRGRLPITSEGGFRDLLGNVWEWMANGYRRAYSQKRQEADGGQTRVLRGGAWYGYPSDCRSAIRYWFTPGGRGGDAGLRLVCLRCVRTP